jgi:hypothetical protein
LRAFIGMMGSPVHRSRAVVVLIALLTLLALTAASATGARHRHGDGSCTWGASSVRAQIVDGQVVATTPAVSGCIPK